MTDSDSTKAQMSKGQISKGECSETLHELYHFLDGELTPERRVHIQQHLDDCPPCYEAFDFEAEVKAYIADRCRERVPDSLRARIAEAIDHLPPDR